jgi:hypothetical protein
MPPDERLDLAKIYEDRGIQLTTAPPTIPGPPEVLSRLREIDREPLRRLDRFVEELQKYRREYLDCAAIKQTLYGTYVKLGKHDFARQARLEAVASFPDHLHTIVNYICSIDGAEEMQKVAAYLGPKPEITHFPAQPDGTYAWENFINYELAAIRFLAVTGQDYAAKKRPEYLISSGASAEELRNSTEAVTDFCDTWKSGGLLARVTQEKRLAISVNPHPAALPYQWETPVFHHPEVVDFYEPSQQIDEFSDQQIDRLLVLPRATRSSISTLGFTRSWM